jgi:cell division GTPase FtsZ
MLSGHAARPTLDRITAIMAALLGPVTGPLDLIGFDFADLRAGLIEGGLTVFGQGEASGPDRAIRAADAALADIRQQLRGGRGIPP